MSIVVYSDTSAPEPSSLEQAIKRRFGTSIAGMYDFVTTRGLFQDATGTSPVTDYGQPIGLVLDGSYGYGRGAEMMPADPAWDLSNNPTAIVSGQRVEILETGNITTVVGSKNGRNYEIAFDVIQAGPSAMQIYVGGIDGPIRFGPATPVGRVTGIKVQPSGSREAEFILGGQNAGWIIDSISLRELPGHHLSQSTTSARPTFTGQGALHDGVDDMLRAASEADWGFLVDGTGGLLGASGSFPEVNSQNFLAATQASGASTAGLSVGARTTEISGMFLGAVVRYSSGTIRGGGAVNPPLADDEEVVVMARSSANLITGFRGKTEFGEGVFEPEVGGSAPLSTGASAISQRTVRRIIAIREAVTDPADIFLLDAWLREGAG